MKTLSYLAGSAALAVGLAMTQAQAVELRIAHGYPAQSVVGNTYDFFAAYVEENSEIETHVFPLTLLDLRQASPGLTSGVADASMVLTPYFPNEFSEANLVGDLTMIANLGGQPTSIGAVIAGAVMEYITMNCDDCRQQIIAQNQIYLASAPGTQFSLLCREPIQSVAQTEGKVLRSSTNTFRRWTEAMGATASSISGNEIYDGLSQRLIDCTVNAIGEMSNFSLFEVVKGITPAMPGGTFGGTAIGHFNLAWWQDLSLDHRGVVARGMAESAAFMVTEYVRQEQVDIERAKTDGIQVVEAKADLADATAKFIEADVAVIAELYSSQYGLQGVDEKIETFRDLVEKWKGLTNDLDPLDQQALATLYWDELLSKLDLETYGLN